jgi:hypothetical protein
MYYEGFEISPFYSTFLYFLNFVVSFIVNGYFMGLVGGAIEARHHSMVSLFLS